MVTFEVEVKTEGGLHARPASILVNKSGQFSSTVKLSKDGKQVDGKSILGVMTLAAKAGDKLMVEVSGADEAEAAKFLKQLFESNFAM